MSGGMERNAPMSWVLCLGCTDSTTRVLNRAGLSLSADVDPLAGELQGEAAAQAAERALLMVG